MTVSTTIYYLLRLPTPANASTVVFVHPNLLREVPDGLLLRRALRLLALLRRLRRRQRRLQPPSALLQARNRGLRQGKTAHSHKHGKEWQLVLTGHQFDKAQKLRHHRLRRQTCKLAGLPLVQLGPFPPGTAPTWLLSSASCILATSSACRAAAAILASRSVAMVSR